MGKEHTWISSVKNLVYIARGSPTGYDVAHHFLKRFPQQREPNSFHRLWIEWKSAFDVNTLNWYNDEDPSMTHSLVVWPEDQAYFAKNYEGLCHLEHVADVPLSRLASKSALKYIRGYCKDAEV